MNKTERRKMYRFIAKKFDGLDNSYRQSFICSEIMKYTENMFVEQGDSEIRKIENLLDVPQKIRNLAWLSSPPVYEDNSQIMARKAKILRLLASGRKSDLIFAKMLAKPSIEYKASFY